MGESQAGFLYVVETLTDSRYASRGTADGGVVIAENVPNGTSVQVPSDQKYLLAGAPAPWPPRRGSPLTFIAANADGSARLPGGGKITAPVVHVEIRSLE